MPTYAGYGTSLLHALETVNSSDNPLYPNCKTSGRGVPYLDIPVGVARIEQMRYYEHNRHMEFLCVKLVQQI
jgi:hypothetical protein